MFPFIDCKEIENLYLNELEFYSKIDISEPVSACHNRPPQSLSDADTDNNSMLQITNTCPAHKRHRKQQCSERETSSC